ncbi:MAG TPA: DUF1801 domain-containing protein [Segetibacter sp.]|jgi:hypothetical protein
MQSTAKTPEEYIASLPQDRKQVISKLREEVLKNLPEGFAEIMGYGMLGYVVPHSLYPAGVHTSPKDPLPFMNIASQKNFISIYHLGITANKALLDWFLSEYSKQFTAKVDMGKSCIRFKKPEQIPYKLIGELAGKITPQKWIEMYESMIKR